MELKDNLKKILKAKDLTAAQLARATNVPKTTIANWLAGTPPKNLDQLKVVADYLEMSIDQLCFTSIPKNEPNLKQVFEDEVFAGIYEVVLRRYKGK